MTGAADPVLLLHGQPGSARDWNSVIAALGARAEPIAIDRPGWDGASRACGLARNAEAAMRELDRANVARATISGYSWGAAVAAWLAATHPDRVSRLVLIAPAANEHSLVALDYLLAAPVVGELASVAALAAVAVWTRRPHAARHLLTPATWGSFVAEQRMLIRELPLLEPLLARIAAPTTIVIGSSDRIVPPSSARRLAEQIPDAELVQIDGANHLLLHQHPGRVADILTG